MSDAGYILGLSLGTTALGWAAIGLKDGAPASILGSGARVFASDGAVVAAGRDVPPNAKRHDARMARRQTARRALRLGNAFRTLQQAGLLPDGEAEEPWQRDIVLKELDARIRLARPPRDRVEGHLLPYLLRTAALDERIEPHELGRALYHLAQRRGFKSNRKSPPKVEEEAGQVASAIHDLREAMTDGGFRTLGSYLASLDPEQRRIRSRWTDRQMLEDELSAIWSAQAPMHPELMTDELRSKLHRAVFRQRPLKAPKVRRCELEPGRPHAAKALLLSQRFRIVQNVLTLRVTNTATGENRSLAEGERAALAKALMVREKLSLARVKTILKLPGDHELDFGRDGDATEITGNTTAAKLIAAIGRDAWDALSDEKRDALVGELRQIENDAVLERRALQVHGLAPEAARRYGAIALEPGYLRLSTRAIAKVLPLMERGMSLGAARDQAYPTLPSARGAGRVQSELAPAKDSDALAGLTNPLVSRSLTELRRVVNAVVRRWGLPTTIRIELSRDLKNSRPQRKALDQSRREEERLRQAASEQILKETNRASPSRSDIERVLLWSECGGVCPFTGRPISFHDLFGDFVDVEHIIPFSRSLDDSFLNKTLRYREERPTREQGLTPREAFHGTEKWDEILERVWKFTGRLGGRKADLFTLKSEEVARRLEDFVSRQLSDTRHPSRLAGDDLGSLYGGRLDEAGQRRIDVGGGQLRALLRSAWGLDESRDDHRHHAVDAVVVALTSRETIQALADASSEAALDPPWPSFRADVGDAVARINVSHRPSRRLSGALHDETSYRRPLTAEGERASFVHRRVRVGGLTAEQVERIVDPRIQAAIRARLVESGESDPRKAFKLPEAHPFLIDRNGRKIWIHAVRVKDTVTTIRIGKDGAEREVSTGDNHHMAIVAVLDADGREMRWEGIVVSLFEAHQRLNRRRAARRAKLHPLPPIIEYGDYGERSDRRPKFTLRSGDSVRLGGDINALCVVRGVTDGHVDLFRADDGRASNQRIREGGIIRRSPDRLRELGCRKVEVDPLGDEHSSND